MRRKRKIRYYVQSWGDKSFWYNKKEGWGPRVEPPCVSMVCCRTLQVAIRHAKRIRSLGANPLIGKRIINDRGGYWYDFRLSDKNKLQKIDLKKEDP